MNRFHRTLLANHRRDQKIARFGHTLVGRRVGGALSLIVLLLIGLTFPYFKVVLYAPFGNWIMSVVLGIGVLFVCISWIVLAILTFIPAHRRKIAAYEEKVRLADEQDLQRLTDAARVRRLPDQKEKPLWKNLI